MVGLDITMDDGDVAVDVQPALGRTDAEVAAALDGQSISPQSTNTRELSVTNGGSVQLDVVGTRHSVPSGESVTIPEGYSEVVVGPYDLDGELIVNGRMEIL